MSERGDIDDPNATVTYEGAPELLHLRRLHLILHPTDPERREELAFEQERLKIGATPGNDVVVDDPKVSREHCRIYEEGGRFVVEDLNSTNGTYLDGVSVMKAHVDEGAMLRVGDTRIEVNPVEEQVPVEPSETEEMQGIVGKSVEMREVFGIVDRIAPTDSTVVIEGETGTGKEVVTEAIHRASPRSEGPFVVCDCGAIPESLVESELFGHEKGSFTGASMSREGLFERADGGTIFLDEIGELSLELQPKLLRVIEEQSIRRVGGNEPIPVDVRIIAATNRDLEEAVERGEFRQDLFYRLSVVRFQLPPLRKRVEDVPLLVTHFLQNEDFNRDRHGDRRVERVTDRALNALRDYDWPGNVRELLNVIERAVSFAGGDVIDVDALADYVTDEEVSPVSFDEGGGDDGEGWTRVPARTELRERTFKQAKEEWIAAFERDYITDLLIRHGGNVTRAAQEADVNRAHFYDLMDKHGLDPDEF